MSKTMISLGLALAAAALLPAQPGAAELRTGDDNGDGKPDRWFVISNGAIVEYRADSDFDGRVDALVKYAGGDRLEYEEYDYNLDGTMDDFYFYENGLLKRREVDSDFDGKVDLWVHLTGGRYVERLEKDTNFDGTVDVVRDYRKRR